VSVGWKTGKHAGAPALSSTPMICFLLTCTILTGLMYANVLAVLPYFLPWSDALSCTFLGSGARGTMNTYSNAVCVGWPAACLLSWLFGCGLRDRGSGGGTCSQCPTSSINMTGLMNINNHKGMVRMSTREAWPTESARGSRQTTQASQNQERE